MTKGYEARDYQAKCIKILDNIKTGTGLVKIGTGLGKTFILSRLKRYGRVLILAHTEELVFQPVKYFDCTVGIEMADLTSNGEEVIIASVQSLINRLENFPQNYFYTIITDECHHAAAPSYQKIYDYFSFKRHFGFTATMRGDGVRLDTIFERVLFRRDMKWGIEHGYLSNIACFRANIGYDLSDVKQRNGDFERKQLEKALNKACINDAIADVYKQFAEGATMIFVSNVAQAEEVASRIKGAVCITGKTKNRSELIQLFSERKIPCIVSVGVFTEGTDIPLIETIIMARPTTNSSLYTQMIGRGLRLYAGKERLKLIDCIGASDLTKICSAASLAGLDLKGVPEEISERLLDGTDFLQLEDKLEELVGASYQIIMQRFDLFSKWEQSHDYNTHDLAFTRNPNGTLTLSLGSGRLIKLSSQNELGHVILCGKLMSMQEALDYIYEYLLENESNKRSLWDLAYAKKTWGSAAPTPLQIKMLKKTVPKDTLKKLDFCQMTRHEASVILSSYFDGRGVEVNLFTN